MNLPDTLNQAAQTFGQALRQNQAVQRYLEAQARLQANPEIRDLDQRYQAMFQTLGNRQRAGEQLPRAELDAFYALRQQIRHQSLIAERDAALSAVKNYFVIVGGDLNHVLKIDYVALVNS
jgi:cell fate (sporulation/competence/biofilm development) regulator YlbF (YheA/YmcA/DUF963 family)